MTDKPAVLILDDKHDKIRVEQLRCPFCGDKFMQHHPFVQVACGKCGGKYRTDFKQDIYTKKSRELNSLLAYNNIVKIQARETFEADITQIQKHFQEMNSWDVSELKQVIDSHRRCEKCGICLNCFTCKNCGKSFEKDKNKRKQTCPHCRSHNFIKTYFTQAIAPEQDKRIKLCPNCKSDNIVMTRSKFKSKCHLCNSKKLSDKIDEKWFILKISRKRAYRKEV